jgi:hypothetical protein
MRVHDRRQQMCQGEGQGRLDSRLLSGSAASQRLGSGGWWPAFSLAVSALAGPGPAAAIPEPTRGAGEHPPARLPNMKALRVSLEGMGAILTPYLHLDPVRGTAYQGGGTFLLSAGPLARRIAICR